MIELVPHDPQWAELFETVASDIRSALGSMALSVHHVGSTAIPGIIAKPEVDVLIFIDTYDPEGPYRDRLASLGYAFDHRDARHVFFTGSREGTKVNVHVVEKGGKDARDTITFRDYLRSHPDEARRYDELKRELAERHSDVNAYGEGKDAYVLGIVRRAGSSSNRGASLGT